MKIPLFKNEQGSALLTSIGIVMVMMAMGICLSKISTDEVNHATLKIRKEAANIAAETGWAVAANWLQDQDMPVIENVDTVTRVNDHNDFLRGSLNSTSAQGRSSSLPTWYDAEIEYDGSSDGHPGYDAEKYDSYNYTITSDGYVSRDLAQKKTIDEIRQSGRFTEVITHIGRMIEVK